MINFLFYEMKSWRGKREKDIEDGDLGDRQECGVRGWISGGRHMSFPKQGNRGGET